MSYTHRKKKIPTGGTNVVVANVPDCIIIKSKFELQSWYYAYFRTNTKGKGMNSLILWLKLQFFNKDGFGIK